MTSLHALDRKNPAQARQAWDTAHLVASVQGIVNRQEPTLFVRFDAKTDDFWLAQLREPGGWLAGRPIVPTGSVEELLTTFKAQFRGLVVYHERVRATSNLASTIAGVEDRICLRFDDSPGSVYRRVTALDLGLRDPLRLFNADGSPLFTGRGVIPGTEIPSSGSAKCDAYLWAKHRYLDTKRATSEYMAYYIDSYWLADPAACSLGNFTLTNHDFFISQRAFFFDLGMWDEEQPVDDPGQPPGADPRTLRALLRTMYDNAGGKIVHIGGFVPWAWKYTNHGRAGGKHGGVDSEWRYAQIISAYNGLMDADAIDLSGMANASFYRHFPLKDRYPQNPKPTAADLVRSGFVRADGSVAPNAYVLFYLGDYDSAAWLSSRVPELWRDPARGRIPCAWAFNPNLDRRAPHVLDYVRTHASPNDWFIAGDSGAGYLNPGMLVAPRGESGLPDGLDAWVRHNQPYYRRYDLSITGFVIDGHAPGMGPRGLDAYLQFSPDGLVAQKIPPRGLHRDTMPFIQMTLDLAGDPRAAADEILDRSGGEEPRFMVLRTILKTPSWHKEVMDRVAQSAAGSRTRFVDPFTFFLLLKNYEHGQHLPRP
ncbi:MAG: hypothetical protein ACYC35_06335 [Pirellulales bacterium]